MVTAMFRYTYIIAKVVNSVEVQLSASTLGW
jgi:hypothetical protein